MKKRILFIIPLLIVLLLFFYVKKDFKKTKPTIYYNGNIITLNDEQPKASAMYVADGKIIEIGNLKQLSANEVKGIKKLDLKGQTVMPGFIDIHTHFALSIFLEGLYDLSGFRHDNNNSVWNYFEEISKETPPNKWIVCKGLDPLLVEDLQVPTIQYLDSIAPSNPVIIFAQSLHSYWANSKAFEMANISNETPNPSTSSYYERDANGKLTSLIVEQEAFKPFMELLKEDLLSPQFLGEMSIKVMDNYAKNGNTTIVSTGLTINDAKPLILTQHLSDEHPTLLSGMLSKIGMLPERKPMPRHFIYMRNDMEHLMPKMRSENDFYNIIGIKHWYDGSPYIGTMYINEPYLETSMTIDKLHIKKGSKGKGLISHSELKQFIKKYHKNNWQIAIHTQGDAAIQEVLDVYEELDSELDFSKTRHRFEHSMMLQNNQIDAMKKLNLTPSFHINHLYYYGDVLNKEILGNERTSNIFPINSTFKKGVINTLHADQPMFESLPFRLIQTAVERKTKKGLTIGEEEKISLQEAIKSLTIYAAWQINMEDKLGSLEKGKYADFIILDKDPYAIPTEKLETIKCLQTFINGNLSE